MKKAYIKPETTLVNVQTNTLLAGSIVTDAGSVNQTPDRIGDFEGSIFAEEW